MNIEQGHPELKKAVAQVKVGMAKGRVQQLMGPPSMVDPFKPDVWNYVHYKRENGRVTPPQTVAIQFRNNVVVAIRR